MTTDQLPPDTDLRAPDDSRTKADQRSRISFRQPISTACYIDAAWWPRTRDLSRELPPLMDVFWTAGREINRITYNVAVWDRAPRSMSIEGRTVRLGAFSSNDPLTVRLSDPWGRERVDILVIAPGADDALAARVLEAASRADGRYRADEIMALASPGSDESTSQ